MFILVECADREINLKTFETLEEAQKTMAMFYEEAGEGEDGEDIFEYEAYKTDANNHANYD